jgi:hypothetical protein
LFISLSFFFLRLLLLFFLSPPCLPPNSISSLSRLILVLARHLRDTHSCAIRA